MPYWWQRLLVILGFLSPCGRVPAHCGYLSQAHLANVTGAKRPRREGSHGILWPFHPWRRPQSRPCGRTSPVQAPSPCCFPPLLCTHTPAGCGQGGTRGSCWIPGSWDLPMSYNPIVVTLSSLKPFFFNQEIPLSLLRGYRIKGRA